MTPASKRMLKRADPNHPGIAIAPPPDFRHHLPATARVRGTGGMTARGEARVAAGTDAVPLKLEAFLPYRLNVVASLVSQALSSIYADRYGIGVPEWRILVTLGEFEAMTAKAIGAHSHMHKTKVSRGARALEKRKLLVRRENRADRREAFLSLTSAGRAIYRELAPGALEFASRLFEAIDPADRAAFERAIDRLTERSRALTGGT